tara:strand:- start:984 stop:1652 length:669 start_codon:yes stop_codon:yes gene_type:complete
MALLPRDVVRSINSQLPKEIGKQVEAKVLKEFEILKNNMIQEFERHPVTREIDAGPNATNTSETLGGYGNLFSFIGFQEGSDPLAEVRSALEDTVVTKLKYSNGVWDFIVRSGKDVLTKDKLFSLTPIPWAPGRSWMDGIETGLSGLGLYLYDSKKKFGDNSKSGTAIQLKGGKKAEKAFGSGSTGGAIKLQRSRYRRVSYMSSILKNFNKSIERLRSTTLS